MTRPEFIERHHLKQLTDETEDGQGTSVVNQFKIRLPDIRMLKNIRITYAVKISDNGKNGIGKNIERGLTLISTNSGEFYVWIDMYHLYDNNQKSNSKSNFLDRRPSSEITAPKTVKSIESSMTFLKLPWRINIQEDFIKKVNDQIENKDKIFPLSASKKFKAIVLLYTKFKKDTIDPPQYFCPGLMNNLSRSKMQNSGRDVRQNVGGGASTLNMRRSTTGARNHIHVPYRQNTNKQKYVPRQKVHRPGYKFPPLNIKNFKEVTKGAKLKTSSKKEDKKYKFAAEDCRMANNGQKGKGQHKLTETLYINNKKVKSNQNKSDVSDDDFPGVREVRFKKSYTLKSTRNDDCSLICKYFFSETLKPGQKWEKLNISRTD